VSNGVNKIISHAVKIKFVAGFNISQTIPCGMDELQAHTNPAFQPFNFEDNSYSSSDSSSKSSKESLSSHAKAESSKAMLDKLSKESIEKDA